MSGRIETGVDRLVELIAQKKRISIADAAKELGVSRLVVTEWAEFLSDEKLITIEYRLSKTYLKERELTKSEIEKKAKEFSTRKETLVRKVDTVLQQISRDSEGFASIRDQFDKLKKDIGAEIKSVRSELSELKKYESIKKKLDADIEGELSSYKEQIKQASALISHEQKRYEQLLGDISNEEKRLDEQKKRLHALEDLETAFSKKAAEVEKFLDRARKEIEANEHSVLDTERHIDKLKKTADNLHRDLAKTKEKKIDPLEAKRKEHEEAIENLRQSVIAKAKETRERVGADVQKGMKAAKNFETFFSKRMDTEKALALLDKEHEHLVAELESLKKAAVGFSVAGRRDVKSHIKELERKYGELAKRKSAYGKKLNTLVNSIFR